MRKLIPAAIAMVAGMTYGGLVVGDVDPLRSFARRATHGVGFAISPKGTIVLPRWQQAVGTAIGFYGPPILVAFAIYGMLRRIVKVVAGPNETCCRKCGRVLSALGEPRCPECGEWI